MARRQMTPRERAIYEQQRRKAAYERRQKRSEFFGYAMRILIMALIAALLFGIVLAISISVSFNSTPEKYKYSLSVTLDGEEAKTQKDIAVRDNKCYVSLSAMSDHMDFGVSGDVHEMNAVFDSGDVITFVLDTDIYKVNGIARTADGVSYMMGSDGDVYVPINFFNGTFDGITLKRKADGRRIRYSLDIDSGFSVAFSDSTPIPMPDMSALELKAEPENDYITDLTEYEQYINPENPDEYIKLINSEHTLASDYIPEDLTNISYTRRDGRATQKMRLAAAKALDAMLTELYANGYNDVTVTSAYRSYAYQQQLFDNKLSYYKKYYDYNTAYAKTATENAVPGTSEHQSGLCADLHNLPSASQAFESKEAYDWLVAHCADFGFILRYPKNKQDITNIIYEPWHYRFVGRYHAQKIMRSGLCLEEYCEENGIGLN